MPEVPSEDRGIVVTFAPVSADIARPLVVRAERTPVEFVIGRHVGCDLRVEHPGVSRQHALLSIGAPAPDDGDDDDSDTATDSARRALELDGPVVRLLDLASTSGTRIDGVRVGPEEPVALRDRDLVDLGPARFVVRIRPIDAEDTAEMPAIEPDELLRDASPEAIAAAEAAPESADADVASDAAADEDPVADAPARIRRKVDPITTRASLFVLLASDGTIDREIGWREFTDTYVPVIAGFARNAGVPPREIDDVIQDVLLNFFRAAKRFEYDPARGRFRGYLKSITLNAIRSRHRRRRPTTRENEDLEMPLDAERADALWDREWTEQLLHRALEQVRPTVQPRTMQAFELYGVRGVPIDAVAEETGMTPAAIRHAKMRILRQVRETVAALRQVEG